MPPTDPEVLTAYDKSSPVDSPKARFFRLLLEVLLDIRAELVAIRTE